MRKLKSSMVFRAGVTVATWTNETRKISFASKLDNIEFNFEMASKGGGTTDVLLKVGKEDIADILQDIAAHFPDLAVDFAQATYTALSKNKVSN